MYLVYGMPGFAGYTHQRTVNPRVVRSVGWVFFFQILLATLLCLGPRKREWMPCGYLWHGRVVVAYWRHRTPHRSMLNFAAHTLVVCTEKHHHHHTAVDNKDTAPCCSRHTPWMDVQQKKSLYILHDTVGSIMIMQRAPALKKFGLEKLKFVFSR